MDEAEGEIWPNPICITRSPVRNMTGEASAHAQHKLGAVKADFVAYNKLTTGLIHSNLKISLLSRNQTNTKLGRKVFFTTWPDFFSNTFATVGEF